MAGASRPRRAAAAPAAAPAARRPPPSFPRAPATWSRQQSGGGGGGSTWQRRAAASANLRAAPLRPRGGRRRRRGPAGRCGPGAPRRRPRRSLGSGRAEGPGAARRGGGRAAGPGRRGGRAAPPRGAGNGPVPGWGSRGERCGERRWRSGRGVQGRCPAAGPGRGPGRAALRSPPSRLPPRSPRPPPPPAARGGSRQEPRGRRRRGAASPRGCGRRAGAGPPRGSLGAPGPRPAGSPEPRRRPAAPGPPRRASARRPPRLPRAGCPRSAAAEASSARHPNANRSHKQLSVRLPSIMCLHTSSAAPRAKGSGLSRAPGAPLLHGAAGGAHVWVRHGGARGSEPRLCLQGKGCVSGSRGHEEPGARAALSLSARSSSLPFPGPALHHRTQPLAAGASAHHCVHRHTMMLVTLGLHRARAQHAGLHLPHLADASCITSPLAGELGASFTLLGVG